MSSEEWINKDVRVPEGSYLASSHETPGAERALLFDRETGNNLGPAEVRDPKLRPGEDPLRDAALVAAGAAAAFVVAKGPAIKRGLDEKVIPAVKAKWNLVFRRERTSGDPAGSREAVDTDAGPRLRLVKSEDADSAEPAA